MGNTVCLCHGWSRRHIQYFSRHCDIVVEEKFLLVNSLWGVGGSGGHERHPTRTTQSLVVTSLQLCFSIPCWAPISPSPPRYRNKGFVQADDSTSVFSLTSACQLVRKQDVVVESDNTPMQSHTLCGCCIKCHISHYFSLCISEPMKVFRQ